MNRFLSKAAIALLLFTVVFLGNRALQTYLGTQASNNIPFDVHELQAGLDKAEKDGSLILVNYTAVWCPSCRKLDQEVFANDDVARTISQHFTFIKVEHDSAQGMAMAQQYNLQGFPRVLVLNREGRKLSELPLSFDPNQYQNNLQKMLMVSF